MGFSLSWCAVREPDADNFLQQLGLNPTGATEYLPETLISTAKLNTGWRVVLYNKYSCPFLRKKDLAHLSTLRDVLFCLVEEHVMASSSEFWSRGQRKWWLSHEGENGPKGLSIVGDVPHSFESIQRECEDQQRAAGGDEALVDYIFEIPLRVAESVVGFKHDGNSPSVSDERFRVLSWTKP